MLDSPTATVVIYLAVVVVCVLGYPMAFNIIRARRHGSTAAIGLTGSAWGFVILAPLCVAVAVWQIVAAFAGA